jgi:hypothetical protein
MALKFRELEKFVDHDMHWCSGQDSNCWCPIARRVEERSYP